jgi:hypothetical protein
MVNEVRRHLPHARFVGFPQLGGAGTQDCMRRARAAGIPEGQYGDTAEQPHLFGETA